MSIWRFDPRKGASHQGYTAGGSQEGGSIEQLSASPSFGPTLQLG